MSDHDLRRLLRARDLAPGDVDAARRAAIAAGRNGERELAAQAWQEVLRRSPRDDEAERRLLELGCELRWRATDAKGADEYENVLDGALLVPSADGLFVAKEPVTYQQFHRFLVAASQPAEVTKRWISGRGRLRRAPLGAWTLIGTTESTEAYVQDASWLGAAAYARWAGGRLLDEREWDHVAECAKPYEGFELPEGEWVNGDDGFQRRPVRSIWDPRPRANEAGHVQWLPEDAFPGVLFRYGRASWFRE